MKREVDLEIFSGPLEILLTLVQSKEISLTRIELLEVLNQVIKDLETDDLNECGNILVIVSTLLEIKARLLLPGEVDLEEEIGKLREDLLEKILVHRRLTKVLDILDHRFERRLKMHTRPNVLNFKEEVLVPIKTQNPASLLECMNVLREQVRQDSLRMDYVLVPLEKYQKLILEDFGDGTFLMRDLIKRRKEKLDVVGFFVVLLEWIRLGRLTMQVPEDRSVLNITFDWNPDFKEMSAEGFLKDRDAGPGGEEDGKEEAPVGPRPEDLEAANELASLVQEAMDEAEDAEDIDDETQ